MANTTFYQLILKHFVVCSLIVWRVYLLPRVTRHSRAHTFFFARLFQFSLVLVSNCQYIRKYYGLCHTYKQNARVTEVMCVCTLHTSLIYFWVIFLRYDWNLFTLGATIDCHPLLCGRLLACRSITSFPLHTRALTTRMVFVSAQLIQNVQYVILYY